MRQAQSRRRRRPARQRRFWRDTHGGSLVEVALLAPVVILLGIGGFEFGMVGLHKMAANGAARAGVQYGTLDFATAVNTAAMEQAAHDDLGNFSAGANVTARQYCHCPADGEVGCTATCSDGSFNRMYVEVTVQDAYDFIMSYPGVGPTFPVSATARMRVR